jgi:hypothetical protein
MPKADPNSRVAVLGASTDEQKYSFKAVRMLSEYDFQPVPVHPKGHVVDGITAMKSLAGIDQPVDTLTLYVNAKISSASHADISKLKPRRVIFNPGAENAQLAKDLTDEGIETVTACTLVMLRTNQF